MICLLGKGLQQVEKSRGRKHFPLNLLFEGKNELNAGNVEFRSLTKRDR